MGFSRETSWRSDSNLTKVWSKQSDGSQPERHVSLAETPVSSSEPVRVMNKYVPKRYRNEKPTHRAPVRPQEPAPKADPSDSSGTIIVISDSDDLDYVSVQSE